MYEHDSIYFTPAILFFGEIADLDCTVVDYEQMHVKWLENFMFEIRWDLATRKGGQLLK